jgi:hypothetical protein
MECSLSSRGKCIDFSCGPKSRVNVFNVIKIQMYSIVGYPFKKRGTIVVCDEFDASTKLVSKYSGKCKAVEILGKGRSNSPSSLEIILRPKRMN